MLPDDFHTIEVTSKEPSLHLHLYGKTLEDLPDRITFPSSTRRPRGALHGQAGDLLHAHRAAGTARADRAAAASLRSSTCARKACTRAATSSSPRRRRSPSSNCASRAWCRASRRASCWWTTTSGSRSARRACCARLGYRDLHVLAGGNAGWKAAGYELYSGVHVPSKAFGEHVEHHDNTPRIAAAELKAKLDAGRRPRGARFAADETNTA